MPLPDWYVAQPEGPDADTVVLFDQLWRSHLKGGGGALDYQVTAPRWQFLCWLADTQDVLLHGSGSADIAKFEPRQADDVGAFGAQKAVYAASDGIWPMYFAIVDRTRVSSLVNASIHVLRDDGTRAGNYYYFSVDQDALGPTAWRPGFVYILPRSGFDVQPDEVAYGLRIGATQWASRNAVSPLARLSVEPTDFPFLEEVRGHDPAVVRKRAAISPDEFPWLDPA